MTEHQETRYARRDSDATGIFPSCSTDSCFLAPTSDPPAHTSVTASSSTSRKISPLGIKLLYGSKDSVVDIIFVHGLAGDREKTWTGKNASTPWPQVMLPSEIPDVRVLTFGYDANIADWRGMVSPHRISNYAMDLLTAVANYREEDNTNERPIIFVCHGLGGLVSEAALLTSRQSSARHLQNILRSTRGILFLGTPHHGTGLARWANVLAISFGYIKQSNDEQVIRQDSEVLAQMQDSFHIMITARNKDSLEPIEITCFYEELPLPVGLVVPRDSAILPGYIPIAIRKNHVDMTKFESFDDPGFKSIYGELYRWMKKLRRKPSEHEQEQQSLQSQQKRAETGGAVYNSGVPLDQEDDNKIRSFIQDLQDSSSHGGRKHLDILQTMENSLDAAFIYSYNDGINGFIPRHQLRSIMNLRFIGDLLVHCLGNDNDSRYLELLAERIYQSSYKILAILVWIRSPSDILHFIQENVNDSDLPLMLNSTAGSEIFLRKKASQYDVCTFTKRWSSRKVRDFFSAQWVMIAPIFTCHDGRTSHYILEQYHILPFMELSSAQSSSFGDIIVRAGRFGSVRPVKIHPDHYDFGSYGVHNPDNIFALKSLMYDEEHNFLREVKALKRFNNVTDSHLIKLLATFEQPESDHGIRYCLIFPWASGNLQDLWTGHPELVRASHFAFWMAGQCKGLAFGLSLIHNGQQSNLATSPSAESQPIYGRHGDIKPSNILWFSNDNNGNDKNGTLVLSDFGLTSYHSRESRSNSAASETLISPTYRPPEKDMDDPISRAFDIWTLGCTFLDFVTWYLLGWEAVLEFSETRVGDDNLFGLKTDTFFHVEEKLGAVVKRQVVQWVDNLHHNRYCTAYIHDFLSLIMEKMLVVEPERRISALGLVDMLDRLLRSCIDNEQYYKRHMPKK